MDQVAEVAGVGKGTLYRRFGDKSGPAAALLDTRERVPQEADFRRFTAGRPARVGRTGRSAACPRRCRGAALGGLYKEATGAIMRRAGLPRQRGSGWIRRSGT
ncbi:TetR family transcriptional regulator [Streptomyces lacrimifluminis]|uniref:TetR family transcriptional regulator n=1 Tax=Streptomyces lacrimifluminis TaxID=1500077 RepID=UPI003570CB8D